MVMSFHYHYHGGTQINEVIHGEKWMSVGSDGMVEMISLHFRVYNILSFLLVS